MKLKRSLGQNFLTDSFFLEKIVQSSQIQKLDDVIEIGPGDGALTELILKKRKLSYRKYDPKPSPVSYTHLTLPTSNSV